MAQTKHSQHFTFVNIYVKSKFINYHIYKVTATEPKVEEKFTSTQFIQRTANCVNFWSSWSTQVVATAVHFHGDDNQLTRFCMENSQRNATLKLFSNRSQYPYKNVFLALHLKSKFAQICSRKTQQHIIGCPLTFILTELLI